MENNQAQEAVSTAFKCLNIKSLIVIDDVIEEEIGIDEIIGLIRAFPEKTSMIQELAGINFADDEQKWETETKRVIESLTKPKISALYIKLAEKNNSGHGQFSPLIELIPNDIECKFFSPTEWINNYKEILQNINNNNRCLCLFDEEFKNDAPIKSGIDLIKNTVATMSNESNIIYALFTHTVTQEAEIGLWRKLSAEKEIPLCEFLVLSKARLDTPEDMATGIKMTLLNQNCERLKNISLEVANEASNKAAEELKKINVYDFYFIVLKSSENEGIWEAQTLFRLFSIFYRKAAQKLVLGSPNRIKVNQLIKLLREIETINTGEHNSPSDYTSKIRREELFEDEDVNKMHMCIDLGDIFVSDKGKKYILVSQPCDLMVRKDGVRRLKSATLLEITDTKNGLNYLDLEYYGHPQQKYIRLNNPVLMGLDILDLAVYSSDGKCNYHPSIEGELLHSSMKNRLKDIKKSFAKKIKEFGDFAKVIEESNITKNNQKSILESYFDKLFPERGLFGIKITPPDSINFGLQRVGRYYRPYVDEILEKYADHLKRDAKDHDYAKCDDVIQPVAQNQTAS